MTSKQVMLASVLFCLGGCAMFGSSKGVDPLISPYDQWRLWAVVPLRNDSGSRYADGAAFADALAQHLEGASNLDVLPVNRTLAALDTLEMSQPSSYAEAMQLMTTLGVDGLIVGTISAYDPYDPMKLGIAVDLYVHLDTILPQRPRRSTAVTSVSAFFNAADPIVRDKIERYAHNRGSLVDRDSHVQYRISMDLYSEFVAYIISWRLLDAESQRVAQR
jgi:hypothetical protein